MHIRIYLLTLFTIFTLSASLEAGPFDDLKKELNDVTKTSQQKSDNEMSFPDYSPLGLRIANGEAVYSDVFYWINADGTIGGTNSGWSRVPKSSRHLVYLVRKEAEQAVRDASFSPEEKALEEKREARRKAAEEEAAAADARADAEIARDEAERHAAMKRMEEEAARREAAEQKKKLNNAYADYVYGTKERPLLKRWRIEQASSLAGDKRMILYLDFGPGVKVKAIRGRVRCTDAFDETAFNTKFEDKNIHTDQNLFDLFSSHNLGNFVDYSSTNNLFRARPLNSNLVVLYWHPNMFLPSGRALAADGIESCSYTLDKAVFYK